MQGVQVIFQQLKKRQIAVGFVVALLLVGFGFAMSFYSYSHSQADNQRIANSLQITNQLEDVLSSIKDVEAGARGYLASEDSTFLDTYYSAYPRLVNQLASLRRLHRQEPARLRSVDTLTGLVEAKLNVARRQILTPNKQSLAVRREYMLMGKRRMDRLRTYAGGLLAQEHRHREQLSVIARESFRNSLVIIFALSMLTFLVLGTLYRLLARELQQRAENEAQLRTYELELQAKIRQLEVSNQELERMAFVASHDMQEPLRKIRAFGDLLTERCSPLLEEEGRMYLTKIITSADRMSLLIRDLLNFSRLTSRREPFATVSLNEVVDRICIDQELRIRESGALVSRGDLPQIEAAALQLEQLLGNLISNALKYIPPGTVPRVHVEAERISGSEYSSLVPDRAYVRLTVSDNGIGFDEKYLDRIFDIFQRLHTRSHYEGTGIGLAICKRVVDYHGGYITAQSQEGVGTTFIVTLPETQNAVRTVPQAVS